MGSIGREKGVIRDGREQERAHREKGGESSNNAHTRDVIHWYI